MFNLLKNTLKGISALVILCMFLSMLNPHVDPEIFPYLVHFGTGYPIFFILNLFLFVIWAWERHRFALYHLGFLLLGLGLIGKTIRLNFKNPDVPETAITIVSHNIGGILLGKNLPAQQQKVVADYVQFLKENGFPDIICTQETNTVFHNLLAEKIGYPYNFNLKKGTVIYSRYELVAAGEIPFSKSNNSVLWADFKIEGQLVRLYNAHLESNKVTADAEKVIDKGEIDDKETWYEIGSVLKRVSKASKARARQAKLIAEHIQACSHPVIFCGDCNDTPYSYTYETIVPGFQDAFLEMGTGIGSTYAGTLPFLRIDYFLATAQIRLYDFHTVRAAFSDHYPIIAEIGIK